MATAAVQGTSGQNISTSLGVAFGANTTAGNLLIAVGAGGLGAALSISGGGTWTAVDALLTITTGGECLRMWFCPNATGGATTVTLSSTSQALGLSIIEVSGAAASPLDGTIHGSRDSGGATGTNPTSTAFSPTAGDFVVGGTTDDNGATTTSPTSPWLDDGSSPFDGSTHELTKTDASVGSRVSLEYQAAASGSKTAGWTVGAAATWGVVWAAFTASGGAPAVEISHLLLLGVT